MIAFQWMPERQVVDAFVAVASWLGFPSNTAYVGTGSDRRYLAVVESEGGSAHIRAHHDDKGWSDDLLELPQF